MSSRASAEPPQPEPLLRVRDLAIDFIRERGAPLPVVSRASFDIPRGAIAGLFGESGSGKTTLALALPGLLAAAKYRVRGSAALAGRELAGLDEDSLRRIRGARIGFIFQDPLLALHPVLRVRAQISEAIRAHPECGVTVEEACAGLDGLTGAYPHQLSGGERQRVGIALALACRPALVIADEPFTALDSTRVLELASAFRDLTRSRGVSFLLIDHSPAVLARIADFALVMYAGRIVERGAPGRMLQEPLHPYTAALLECLPRAGAGVRPKPIPGNPPALVDRPRGCPFEPRCARRQPRCAAEMPGEFSPEKGRQVACFLYG